MSNPCEQADKIEAIQDDLGNHKVWRRDTTTLLTDLRILCSSIDARLKNSEDSVKKHIDEGEKEGGWRDRLVIVEQSLKTQLLYTILAGIIGGLIGAGAPAAVGKLVKAMGLL
jgi:hypothetical protein